jgi:hypothetical protein
MQTARLIMQTARARVFLFNTIDATAYGLLKLKKYVSRQRRFKVKAVILGPSSCCGISAQIVHANGTLAFGQPIHCGVVAPVV